MPLLSVLTPTQAHNAEHLLDVWDSTARQPLPAGWELEWLVQEDGAIPAVRGLLPDDPRIRLDAVGAQLGPSATRTLALERARGDVVVGIDHDDTWHGDGLAVLVGLLDGHADAGWACGNFRFVLEDGGEWRKPPVFDDGVLPAGTITDHFLATGDFPFAAAFTAYRRRLLQAHGGWPAVPRSEDAVLLAAFSDHHDGVWTTEVVADYRRWPQQRTQQEDRRALRDGDHVLRLVRMRRDAERAIATGA